MSDSDTTPTVSAHPEDSATPGGTSTVSVDRLEERLSGRAVARPVERVRLEKYIVTEEQTISVTVRREEFRLVRNLEPRPAEGQRMPARVGDIEDVELTLHEERIVVTREVVPVEKIRLAASVVTENHAVEATVRAERVEVTRTFAAHSDSDADRAENLGDPR